MEEQVPLLTNLPAQFIYETARRSTAYMDNLQTNQATYAPNDVIIRDFLIPESNADFCSFDLYWPSQNMWISVGEAVFFFPITPRANDFVYDNILGIIRNRLPIAWVKTLDGTQHYKPGEISKLVF